MKGNVNVKAKVQSVSPTTKRVNRDYNPPQAAGVAPADHDDAAKALRQFRMVFSAVRSHFQSVEHRVGVGGAQLWALGVIGARSGIGVNELARVMDIRQPTASNLVRALAAAGLVTSQRSARDRRLVELSITPSGRSTLKKAPGPYSGVLPAALQSMPAKELSDLTRSLDRLIQILGVDERAAVRPLAHL